jgi:hypothetical protein
MSEQLGFLTNVIESSENGNEAAIEVLRTICTEAATKAPVYDLIAIGKCIAHLGKEAAESNLRRN